MPQPKNNMNIAVFRRTAVHGRLMMKVLMLRHSIATDTKIHYERGRHMHEIHISLCSRVQAIGGCMGLGKQVAASASRFKLETKSQGTKTLAIIVQPHPVRLFTTSLSPSDDLGSGHV